MTETPQQDRVDTANLRDYSQLRRSVTDRKVAGVAGGLGRHLNIDPTVLRVAFVVLAFFGGAGFLLYAALWLFVPEDGKAEAPIATSPSTRNVVLAVTAVTATFLLLGDAWGGFYFPWPLAVVALVVLLIVANREKPMSSTTYPPPPPGVPGPVPDDGETTTYAGYAGAVPPTAAYPVQQPTPPRPYRGPRLFGFTIALLAVALGTLGLFEVSGAAVPDAAYPALALAVIGAMLVVGAWFGRPGGLVPLGIVVALGLAATSVAEPRFEGDRRLEAMPTVATQVEDSYSVPAGAIEVDLSNIRDVDRLDGRTIDVDANAGEIVVILPQGLDVNVDANISGAGHIDVLGEDRDGLGASLERTVDGGAGAPEIDLNLDLMVGSIEVRQ